MKYRFLISLLAIASLAQAQDMPTSKLPPVKWYSFEDALQINAERAANQLAPKKIFVDVYTDWCGWCKRMDITTFSHPIITDYLNSVYIPVKLNAERNDTVFINGQRFVNPKPGQRGTHELAAILLGGQMSYPSFVVIDEKGVGIQVIPGYQSPASLEKLLKFFGTDAYLTTKWEEYIQTFKGLIIEP